MPPQRVASPRTLTAYPHPSPSPAGRGARYVFALA
ncbi:Hypothetical Protein XCAW_03545 [Xanthomonas citri subsp. citri Aw12879]|nr:Hypothetical Protein XCAW_03545 [Xanthomonas citri subsp. citri Aw12879]